VKRRDILTFLAKQFDRIGTNYPMYEIKLDTSVDSTITVPRTLFIEADKDRDIIVNWFKNFGISLSDDHIRRYSNKSDLVSSDLISVDQLNLTNNWRGRLIKWSKLSSISGRDDFEKTILKSYWRLIVTKNSDDFFTRHEITPYYYSPGYSTAGFDSFKSGIDSFLKFLDSMTDVGQTDSVYDQVVILARKEPDKVFTKCIPAFFNNEELITLKTLQKEIHSYGKNAVSAQIESSINIAFK